MSSIRVAIVLASVLGLVSCNRDPNVAKKHYLENGNKYFNKGKYPEAAIMYKVALQKDKRYGEAYYRLGLTSLKLNKAVEAVGQFRRAIELVPPSQPDHWDAVVKISDIYLAVARQKQYMDEVLGFTKELLARDPNSFDGHRLLADWNYVQGNLVLQKAEKDQAKLYLTTAIGEYHKALAAKPGATEVLLQLGMAETEQGDFAAAEDIYRQVIGKEKTYQRVYNELYKLYMYERKYPEAEQILKLGFQNNPQSYAFLTSLASFYWMQRRNDDMLAVLQQIKSHAKDYPEAYLRVGDFYLGLGNADSATKEYRDGIAHDPKNAPTYQKRIIEVLMRQNKRSEAADINQQILKANPNDSDAKGLEATLMLDKGDIVNALNELQQVVTRDPNNPVARYNLGRAYAAHADFEQARQQFQKAIELQPSHLRARLALAQLEVTRGEYDAAVSGVTDILKIDPNNLNAQLIRSAALMGQKKFGEAQTLLEAMRKAIPNSPDVMFQLGAVELAQSKFKDAEESFRHSYELNPANSRGLMGVVEVYMAQDKSDAALKMLQAEAAKAPTRLDLQLAMGNVAVRAGKYDTAIGYFQHVLDSLDKTSKARADMDVRLAETYRLKGDLSNSINYLQNARKIRPDSPVVLSALALVLDTANRWPEAKQVYDATLKINPNDGVVLNNVAFLMAEHDGDLNEALTLAQRAKQLMPNLGEVSDTLGWIYLKKFLSDKAIDVFQDLVNKSPHQSTYRYHLAMAYAQKGDKNRARKELTDALKDSPVQEERQKIQETLAKLQ